MPRKPAFLSVRRGSMDPNKPEPGRWMVRMGRGRPPMPASISFSKIEPGSVPPNPLDTGPILVANIGWKDADPLKVWVMRRDRDLTLKQYEFEMTRVSWIKSYAPAEPEAKPHQPVDLKTVPPIGPSE